MFPVYRKGMPYTEEDWVDEDATSHRDPDECRHVGDTSCELRKHCSGGNSGSDVRCDMMGSITLHSSVPTFSRSRYSVYPYALSLFFPVVS